MWAAELLGYMPLQEGGMVMTKDETNLRRQIKSKQALYSLSNNDMAVKMHLSKGQWERRLANPGKITFSELCQLRKILKMEV